MSKVKISVLVPIYNSADYLEQCLNSLTEQSMKELEFILVNDGSIDQSLEIMQKYKDSDSRFVILNKENTGYGDSLNKAMNLAKGDYIGIVEPDDFCDRKMFEVLNKLAESGDFDIVRGEYFEFCNDKKKRHRMGVKVEKRTVFVPLRDYAVFYEAPAIWSAIYRKKMINDNNIRFLPTAGAAYQDAGFNFKTLACAKEVVYTDRPVYYYRIDNPNSSVKDSKKASAVVREYKEVENFIEKMPDGDLLVKYCQVAKFGAYHWNLQRLRKKEWKKFAKIMKEEFKKEQQDGNIERKYFPRKYWLSLMLLINAPVNLYYVLFIVRQRLK